MIGPVLFTLFIWWFSTGLILFLDRLPVHTFRWSLLGASVLAAIACGALVQYRNDTSVAGAYATFTAAIAVWAWHECAFLMGFLTGPRTESCPSSCTGWRRFSFATQVIMHHELALLATAGVVVTLTAGGANQVGVWTFMALWIMRLSTKINLYLGVPNIGMEFLPDHLRYIGTYFAKRPMNLFFPLSVTLATISVTMVLVRLSATDISAFETAGLSFIATLLALAVLEHWFLVAPLPIAALWSWSLRSRDELLLTPVEQPALVEAPACAPRRVNPSVSRGRSS